MNNELNRELMAYFERDIGRPPEGARQRVLAGLSERAALPRQRNLAWMAGAAALVLAVLTIAALLGLRGATLARPTRPAGPGAVPAPRAGAAVAYDAKRSVLVLFGGTTDGVSALDDTWTWDGARWTRLHPAASPPQSTRSTFLPGRGSKPIAFTPLLMADDGATGTLVLYGVPGSTWTWDGRTWHGHPGGPPLDSSATMAYDPTSRAVLLYVGASHQTWRWDGASWAEIQPRTTPDVVMGVLAFDGTRPVLVGSPSGLVEGQTLTRTWAWNGADWSLLAPAVRLPASTWSIAYDAGRRRVVAVAGAETWLWDGATWSRAHPPHQPPTRYGAAMAYDPRTRTVVLYGGASTGFGPGLGDLWAWDGTDWRQMEVTR